MGKKPRRPAPQPDVRQTWLNRYEINGESPPQIALKDGYDVRTVRKYIQEAIQEREAREARSLVLRNALESHYRDLCKYAEDLSSTIAGDKTFSRPTPDRYIGDALNQHLPRSPIWKDLKTLDLLNKQIEELEKNIRRRLEEEIKQDKRFAEIVAAGEDQAIDGINALLNFQIKSWAQGQQGLNIKDSFKTKPADKGLVNVQCGFAQMGEVKKEHVRAISEGLNDYGSKITDWVEYKEMESAYRKIKDIKESLIDELAIITHKRVVPGKCKYCPI
jgi:hypothetical protein